MVDCQALRSLFQSYMDGEAAPEEHSRAEAHLQSCRDCRDSLSQASWEVGLFILNSPVRFATAGASGAGLSAGFSDRVMTAVRSTPRAPAAPPPLRLVPSAPAARASRVGPWIGAAAAVAAAAAAAFLLLTGEPAKVPTVERTTEKGRGTLVALDGGVLRWTGRFDRSLEGSVWTAKDGSAPTLPGEILHSPAPSSIRMRLPEGGRLAAGPHSWLSVGEGDAIALAHGALTASAGKENAGGAGGEASPLVVDAPGGRVTSRGEVEVSVRAADPSGDAAVSWLGAWAAARRDASRKDGGRPAAALPPPPPATIVFFARKGPAEVVASPGPVRNSLERHTLRQGQALILIGAKTYFLTGVDDDAPPERASWLGGMPVPPDSTLFPASGTSNAPSPPDTLNSGGPVRNSLERALSDPASDPDARAYALSVVGELGGAEAVERAARAVDDPAVPVRAAAVRVLALNAREDKAIALKALRRLALDRDTGVAVFAIRSLRALEDRGAVPVLKSIVVDDDAPPELPPRGGPAVVVDDAPPDAARVHAFAALVYFGDSSLVAEAAALAPRVERDPVLAKALEDAISRSFERLPRETARAYLVDPRPAVRAAAVEASRDAEAARAALGDGEESVRISASIAFIRYSSPLDFEALRPFLRDASVKTRAFTAGWIHRTLLEKEGPAVPGWLLETFRSSFEDGNLGLEEHTALAALLARAGEGEFLRPFAVAGTPSQKTAVLAAGAASPAAVLAALGDGDPAIRRQASHRLPATASLPEAQLPTASLLEALGPFEPATFDQAREKAFVLVTLAQRRGSEEALRALQAMATAGNVPTRLAALSGFGAFGSRPEVASALEGLAADSDRATAEAAADRMVRALRRPGWAGRAPAALFPFASPHAVVRAQVALAARDAGVAGAAEAVRKELAEAPSFVRLRILERVNWYWKPLDFLDPALVADPEPLVRFRLLLATTGPARLEAALALAADPAFWVQATALAVLAESGDGAAREGLRLLVGDRKAGADAANQLLAALDPAAEDLPSQALRVAALVADSGTAGRSPVDADAAPVTIALETVARARAYGSIALSPADGEARAAAATGLGTTPDPLSLDVLVGLNDTSREADPRVREAARAALRTLLYFDPVEGAGAFYAAHRHGFVGENEVRARRAR